MCFLFFILIQIITHPDFDEWIREMIECQLITYNSMDNELTYGMHMYAVIVWKQRFVITLSHENSYLHSISVMRMHVSHEDISWVFALIFELQFYPRGKNQRLLE